MTREQQRARLLSLLDKLLAVNRWVVPDDVRVDIRAAQHVIRVDDDTVDKILAAREA